MTIEEDIKMANFYKKLELIDRELAEKLERSYQEKKDVLATSSLKASSI